jgi:hypothetical protein
MFKDLPPGALEQIERRDAPPPPGDTEQKSSSDDPLMESIIARRPAPKRDS